ncbi:MAG: energy transducer TonB, partial [Methylocella sp.]
SSRTASAAAAAASRSACAAGLGSLNKHYPEAALARGEQGTVRIALTIGRNGRVQSARVIGSSGSTALDQAALQMARSASCPAMETSANFTLPVRFSVR